MCNLAEVDLINVGFIQECLYEFINIKELLLTKITDYVRKDVH